MTENSISLSFILRQRGDGSIIHAGQKLPDKEFRYFKTVTFTAAVYSTMVEVLAHRTLSSEHRANRRHYTASFDFAMSCVFVKQSPPPFLL